MYKLLIADDEIWIRERMAKEIAWSSINVQVAGVAEDGREALELAEKLQPDIIISDIRMPEMDGVELMHALSERSSGSRMIILSGYDDFAYVKEALKFRAFDYVLKPVEDEVLLDIVKKCILVLALEREQKNSLDRMRAEAKKGRSLIKEKLLLSLILGEYRDNEAIIDKDDQIYSADVLFRNCIEANVHLCILVQIDCQEKTGSEYNLEQFITINIFSEILSSYGILNYIFLSESEELLFLLSMKHGEGKEIKKKLKDDLLGIKNMIKEKMQFTMAVGIGEACDSFWDISYAFTTAQNVFHYRKWLGTDYIFDSESISLESKTMAKYSTAGLSVALTKGDLSEAEHELKDIFIQISRKSEAGGYILAYRMAAVDIGQEYYKYLANKYDTNYANMFRIELLNNLEKIESGEGILILINKYCSKMDALPGKGKRIADKAIMYIAKYYMNPIALNDVADYLKLNPSYFCRVFKDETGTSFITFLQNYRIDKAIEYMKNPGYKIYQIGAMVGYENHQYFNKVFKSVKGIAPAAYREQII